MLIRKNTDRRKELRNGRSGSIAVEAAILLPLFIVGILTIGYLLKFCMISEGIHHSLADEAHAIMAEASVKPYPIGSESEIVSRIDGVSRGEASAVSVARFLYRIPGLSSGGRAYTDLIAISVSFDTPLKLPRLLPGETSGERTILCRAFVGATQYGAEKPFDEMEQDDSGDMVWIFPRAGERYHDRYCAYIENNPHEVLLDRNIRNKYSPCKLCGPDGYRDGTLVYCFETSGRAYHTAECTIVDRYVIEISKDDAETQGYTPCSKCGGGGAE